MVEDVDGVLNLEQAGRDLCYILIQNNVLIPNQTIGSLLHGDTHMAEPLEFFCREVVSSGK
jgi:hypothetical protein